MLRLRLPYILLALATSLHFSYGDSTIGAYRETATKSVTSAVAETSDSSSASSTNLSVSSARSGPAAIANSTATCLSKTVNYITHTLPQQCLRTNRSSSYGHNSTVSNTNSTQATSSPYGGENNDSIVTVEHPEPHGPSLASRDGNGTAREDASKPEASSEEPSALSHSTQDDISAVASSEQDAETDSPLDNANFLSFEDWKRQNLAKAGQNPDTVGQSNMQAGERRRPGINNALDTLGEDSEIELDFSGFGGGAFSPDPSRHKQASSSETGEQLETPAASQNHRSKDAGKTCKERGNYASFDCGASMLKFNSESKSASSILVENKDSYMLNTCSASNKFLIVELCDSILVDTVVLANYEFFSSIFRQFRVSVSDRYPVKMDKWEDLGTFEARNTREVQAFLVQHPQIWARYLRVEFLSHYGSEYYCPLSLLRVHGTTMLEQFRQEQAREETGEVEEEIESDVTSAVEPVPQEPLHSTDEVSRETKQAVQNIDKSELKQIPTTEITSEPNGRDEGDTSPTATTTSPLDAPASKLSASSSGGSKSVVAPPLSHQRSEGTDIASEPTGSSSPMSDYPQPLESTVIQSIRSTPLANTRAFSSGGGDLSTTVASNSSIPETTPTSENSTMGSADFREGSPSVPISAINTTTLSLSNEVTNVASDKTTVASSNSTRQASSTIGPSVPQPSTQESFFNSIHKRLKQLESNSTLSLQYIEEQSRILRDAFSKVEKRQLGTTTTFLSNLNATVMSELQGFRQAYDQLWQSTVIELEGQREQYQREMMALSSRLTFVAEELVWQKRLGIVQSTLILLCLGLILFARSPAGNAGQAGVDIPLLQQMVQRSHAAAMKYSGYDSEHGSPSPTTSRSPVGLLRRKLWRRSGGSRAPGTPPIESDLQSSPEQLINDTPRAEEKPELLFEPPTPPSREDESMSSEDDGEDLAMQDPEINGTDPTVKQTQSSPSTPSGTRDGLREASTLPWHDESDGGGSQDGRFKRTAAL